MNLSTILSHVRPSVPISSFLRFSEMPLPPRSHNLYPSVSPFVLLLTPYHFHTHNLFITAFPLKEKKKSIKTRRKKNRICTNRKDFLPEKKKEKKPNMATCVHAACPPQTRKNNCPWDQLAWKISCKVGEEKQDTYNRSEESWLEKKEKEKDPPPPENNPKLCP